MKVNFKTKKVTKTEEEKFNEELKNLATIITNKRSIYLEKEDKWILLSILLYNFGANYDYKKKELHLHWGIRDKEHFKFIQRIIDSLIDSTTIGNHDQGLWKIHP